jgi:hypothetical protein
MNSKNKILQPDPYLSSSLFPPLQAQNIIRLFHLQTTVHRKGYF